LANKTFAVCNEAGNGLRECMDRMKEIATEPHIHIERKGKDPIRFDNYCNLWGATNNHNPFDIAIDDRRMVWIECDNKHIGDEEYFKTLVAICKSDEGVSSFYHYFKEEVNITIENFQIERPITEEYMKIQKLNTPNPIKFLLEFKELEYRKYKGEENAVVKRTRLYMLYKEYCDMNKFQSYNKDGFESRIVTNETGISLCTFHGQNVYKFNKETYQKWLEQYKKLDGDVEDIVFDDEEGLEKYLWLEDEDDKPKTEETNSNIIVPLSMEEKEKIIGLNKRNKNTLNGKSSK
jgi:hypothetical protein